eukprot:Hpha_TRINITY_DN16596_c4_g5::TRINITY_DN16596_c4_g5_i1::g.136146::m.136146
MAEDMDSEGTEKCAAATVDAAVDEVREMHQRHQVFHSPRRDGEDGRSSISSLRFEEHTTPERDRLARERLRASHQDDELGAGGGDSRPQYPDPPDPYNPSKGTEG